MTSQNLIHTITLGSDPEVFLFDPKLKQFVSSIDRIGGTKYAPLPMDKDGFFIQEDNVLAEFNIPPANNEDEFVTNLILGLSMVQKHVPTLELKIQGSAFIPESELSDPRAKIFGCDPDFNAWTGKMNPQPSDEVKASNLRSAGGHIGVGYFLQDESIQRIEVNRNIVKWMDLFLAVPSVLMDKDKERRKLYGKAGAHRNTNYGVEYRTLSSFWLSDQKLMRWAYRNTLNAVKMAGEEKFIDKNLEKRIISCVNTGNEELANDLIKTYSLEVA